MMVAGDGAVKGIRGRVHMVVQSGVTRECRPEDRGLLLFTSSMTAVKVTADACRQAAGLLNALMIDVEARDVFVNLEYASQLKRLHAEHSGGATSPTQSKKGLPELPQLYANGKLIGGLADLKALDDEGKLASTLEPYRLDHQRGREIEANKRHCDECGGRRFLVCDECNGSRRGKQVFGKYLKCAYCNENGLRACASCNLAERREPTVLS